MRSSPQASANEYMIFALTRNALRSTSMAVTDKWVSPRLNSLLRPDEIAGAEPQNMDKVLNNMRRLVPWSYRENAWNRLKAAAREDDGRDIAARVRLGGLGRRGCPCRAVEELEDREHLR